MVYTDGVHVVATTIQELHLFASSIGLKREWFQPVPTHPHYDTIAASKKRLAIQKGALMVKGSTYMARAKVISAMFKNNELETLPMPVGLSDNILPEIIPKNINTSFKKSLYLRHNRSKQ